MPGASAKRAGVASGPFERAGGAPYMVPMSARPLAIVPLLLLAVPIAEIAAFIAVGQWIGIGWTLLMILVTAVIGTVLLRVQGLGLLARAQGEVAAGRVPARELVHGVMLLVAGVLLLTPGFITDTLGFLLFVPALRDWGWRHLRARISVRGAMASAVGGMGRGARGARGRAPGRGPMHDDTIDLGEDDYRRTDPAAREPDPSSRERAEPVRVDPAAPAEPDREPDGR